jgi:hypothetical protein
MLSAAAGCTTRRQPCCTSTCTQNKGC